VKTSASDTRLLAKKNPFTGDIRLAKQDQSWIPDDARSMNSPHCSISIMRKMLLTQYWHDPADPDEISRLTETCRAVNGDLQWRCFDRAAAEGSASVARGCFG
jgi:hypothetical protein